MVYVYELDQNLCNIIGTIFAVKISRKFAKNWWISLDQLLWSTEVNFCQMMNHIRDRFVNFISPNQECKETIENRKIIKRKTYSSLFDILKRKCMS